MPGTFPPLVSEDLPRVLHPSPCNRRPIPAPHNGAPYWRSIPAPHPGAPYRRPWRRVERVCRGSGRGVSGGAGGVQVRYGPAAPRAGCFLQPTCQGALAAGQHPPANDHGTPMRPRSISLSPQQDPCPARDCDFLKACMQAKSSWMLNAFLGILGTLGHGTNSRHALVPYCCNTFVLACFISFTRSLALLLLCWLAFLHAGSRVGAHEEGFGTGELAAVPRLWLITVASE